MRTSSRNRLVAGLKDQLSGIVEEHFDAILEDMEFAAQANDKPKFKYGFGFKVTLEPKPDHQFVVATEASWGGLKKKVNTEDILKCDPDMLEGHT